MTVRRGSELERTGPGRGSVVLLGELIVEVQVMWWIVDRYCMNAFAILDFKIEAEHIQTRLLRCETTRSRYEEKAVRRQSELEKKVPGRESVVLLRGLIDREGANNLMSDKSLLHAEHI